MTKTIAGRDVELQFSPDGGKTWHSVQGTVDPVQFTTSLAPAEGSDEAAYLAELAKEIQTTEVEVTLEDVRFALETSEGKIVWVSPNTEGTP